MATATQPKPPSTPALNGTAPHVPAAQTDAPTAQLISLSPAMASSLLETAHANRKISATRVRQLTKAMQSGRWQVNGQGLVLCEEGRLLDGRHRCSAVVAANVTIQTMVCCGVSAGAFLTMDSGRRRNGGDLLGIAGYKQSQTLASALRWVWRYENAAMLQASIPIADYELVAFLDQHQTIITSLSWGSLLTAMVPAGVGVMLHLFMSAKDPGLAKQFFTSLAQGIALSADDPEYRVRERLIHEKRELFHKAIVERCALICRGWNCRRGVRPLPAGRWQGTSEMFPVIE